MSVSTYYYDPIFEPLFTFMDGWDTPGRRDVQRRDDSRQSLTVRPKMDLHENKDKNEMTATFELPGMKKEDVSIDVHNNRLVISGQSTISDDLDNEGYAVRERRYGRFTRAVPLPVGTKPEEIKAGMENGVLKITFPRTQPESQTKRIAIS